jgi:membrane protein
MQGTQLVKNPNPGALFDVLKEAYREWSEDKASRLAAALAYYTAFSIAPLLLIAISIAGLVFGRAAAQGQVFGQLQGLLGPEAAGTIQASIATSQDTGASTLSAIIGLAMLVWSASNVFSQLQDALNTIWEVQPDPRAGIGATVKRRFLSMTMVLGIGFLLLVSLLLSAGISVVGAFFQGLLPGGAVVWQFVNVLLSFGIITLLFAAIYKILPDVEIAWSDVWVGAAATALLFTIGKLLIGLYLGHATVGSTFGAAGSLLVFLVWVYYSAQILFFGAELTQVYARKFGSRIKPAAGAIALTEEARAEQGMAHAEALESAAAGRSGASAERQPVAAAVHADGRTEGRANGSAHATATQARMNGHANGHANGVARNGAHDADHADHADGRNGSGSSKKRPRGSGGTKGAPDAVKKLLWSGLVAGSTAVVSVAARRASTEIWRRVLHQDPPTKEV